MGSRQGGAGLFVRLQSFGQKKEGGACLPLPHGPLPDPDPSQDWQDVANPANPSKPVTEDSYTQSHTREPQAD